MLLYIDSRCHHSHNPERGSLQKKSNDERWGDLDLGWGVEKGFQETAEVEAGSTRQKLVGGKFQADEPARAER